MFERVAEPKFGRIQPIAGAIAFAFLLLLSGWYVGQRSALADSEPIGNTIPPYQNFTYVASPSINLSFGSQITHTISFVRRNVDYPATLSFTNSVPFPLVVVAGSLRASTGATPSLQDGIISWTATFEPNVPTSTETLMYVTTVEDCFASTVPTAARFWAPATGPLTNTVWLQELTNAIVTSPAPAWNKSAVVELTLPPCMVHAPTILKNAPFPIVRNGKFDSSSSGIWTELVNGAPDKIIYPNAELPVAVRRSDVPYVAWLGGIRNSTNVLSQTINSTGSYPVRLKFQYYSASEEDNCGADQAWAYAGGTLLKQFGLCNSLETNKWVTEVIDFPKITSPTDLFFKTVLNGSRNSNLFIYDIQFCSDDANVPPGTPKCTTN